MKNFQFTDEEQGYLREIHKILKFGEFPNLYYVIGYNKVTGKRKIFLFYNEMIDGEEYIYAVAEILNQDTDSIQNIEFQFSDEKVINYKYRSKTPWWKFWNRLTERRSGV